MRNGTSLTTLATLGLCALAACGGGTDEAAATSTAKFTANAPSFDQVSLQIDDADANPPAAYDPSASNALTMALTSDRCHPHLFARTHEITQRINRHTNKMLARVKAAIAKNPLENGGSKTWERVDADGITHTFTMSKSASGDTFTFTMTLTAKGSTTPVQVFNGSVQASSTTTGTNTVVEQVGTMVFDFDAYHSVIADEKATGKITIDFDHVKDPSKPAPGVKKTMTIKFDKFLPEEGDPHGPRTGTYTHLGEPGTGGLLTFQDSLILLCPANPDAKLADTTTVARWFKGADGKVHGRSDAKASGGQIAAGNTWIGASCHNGTATTRATESAYWMMKLEDGTGATLQGSAFESSDGAAEPCDPAFGPVPALKDNKTDYDFTQPATFPGAW